MPDWLKVLQPQFWIRNYPYCEALDVWLNKALDAPEFKNVGDSDYYIELNGVDVWVSNYPYAYGTVGKLEVMPSRKTVLRLKQAVDQFRLKEVLNEQH